MQEYLEKITTAADFIRRKSPAHFEVGIVLGTGLGPLADKIKAAIVIPYAEIPYFPVSTVPFHAGRLVMGELENKTVLAMQGRFHAYEGYHLRDVTLPIRVMHALGIRQLILTNAVGGIQPHLTPGSLAVVRDHINLMGMNPLIGPYDAYLGVRFPDMSEPYDPLMRQKAFTAAQELNIPLPEAVYAAVSGPSYETEAEIRMLQIIGADTVGMSVVPETLVARQLDMAVLAINAITDQSLPGAAKNVTHEEVSKVAAELSPVFIKLLCKILRLL